MPETDPIRWLAQEFSNQFGKALEGMAGQSFPVTWQAVREGDYSNVSGLWWETGLSHPSGARVFIGAEADSWTGISRTLLESIGLTTDDASVRSTYIETLAQAASGLASALGSKLGREVTCGAGSETNSAPSSGLALKVSATLSDGPPSAVFVVFSPELVSVLAPRPAAVTPPATMDLLLDVELPVSVSFGRAELPLKDVVKLTTGSIVELNRSITEPVEIIVNNCVIARGEVVVIEGNYGVRIDQIISRQERLRTLK